MATVGEVNNPEFMHIKIGKAGRKTHGNSSDRAWQGDESQRDHPHGGGEARSRLVEISKDAMADTIKLEIRKRRQVV